MAGFEPMVLPPRGPDGMIPAGPPARLSVLQPPSLCEAGPCRHYHRVASVMDAEDGGRPGAAHRQVTRACYPAVGIELELGETPVLRCSRWEPDNEQARLDSIRQAFMKSAEGRAFAEKVAAFEEAEAAFDDESAEAGGGLTGVESDLGDEGPGQVDDIDDDDLDDLDADSGGQHDDELVTP